MQPSPQLTPEPGAISGNPQPNGMPAQAIQGPPDWGALDAGVPPSFVSVEPVTLQAGTPLYRVFSAPSDADPYPSWEVGSWWSPNAPPASEADWRSGYAVEESWNGGQYYVQWTLPAVVYAWSGPASLQYGEYTNGEKAPGYYLPGGLTQIYIAPDRMGIGAWASTNSPWSPASTVETVAQPPEVADQSYAGLEERLGQLSQVLTGMAAEARRKGVFGTHLLFQAARVFRDREFLERHAASAPHLRVILLGLTQLARHVHTYYPWSARSAIAAGLVTDIVVRADRLFRHSG